MKERTVIVTLEIETDAPLKDLRNAQVWFNPVWMACAGEVRQASAQVATPPKARAKKKARR